MNFIENKKNSLFWMVLFTFGVLIFLNFTISSSVMQINSLDPYYYTGYINNYRDLIERYGRTYWSSRVAFIYPARLLNWLFGSEGGYLVFRSILVFGMIAAAWRMAIRFYRSKWIAAFIAFFVVVNPWFIRSLCWDYIDGAAIVYVFLSVSFFILPKRVSRASYFFSGVFFLLGINCNIFVAGIFIAFLPLWYALFRESASIAAFVKNALFFLTGLLSAYLFFIGITYWEFPSMNPFFDYSTYRMSKWMLKGGGLNWMSSITAHISQGGYYVIYPLFVLVLCGLFRIFPKKGRFLHPRLGFLTILCLFLTACVYLFVYFVLNINVFCYCYYSSYAIPATFFALIWLVGESFCFLDRHDKTKILVIGGGFYALSWIFTPHLVNYFSLLSGVTLIIAAITFLLLFTACAIFNRTKLKACLVAVVVLLSPLLFYRAGSYASIHSTALIRKEWDLYHGAIYLQKLITGKLDPKSGKVGFWYAHKPGDDMFNSIQSVFLWGFSRLSSIESGAVGMPVVDDNFRKCIDQYKYLVLLASTEGEIREGRNVLNEEGIQATELLQSEYRSREINYHILVLEKNDKFE